MYLATNLRIYVLLHVKDKDEAQRETTSLSTRRRGKIQAKDHMTIVVNSITNALFIFILCT